jgi:hypothetical protein
MMRSVLLTLVNIALAASLATAKDHAYQRGTIVSMSAVECGSQTKRHKKTQELLCQEYVVRSESMEYHIRQGEPSRTALLPVGQEAEFRLDKDRMRVRVPGSGKEHEYVVVSEVARTDANAPGSAAQQ